VLTHLPLHAGTQNPNPNREDYDARPYKSRVVAYEFSNRFSIFQLFGSSSIVEQTD
jgi:hypothetical protein